MVFGWEIDMITPSFCPTATERVLPKLALDFTTASLDPRITFTRAGGANTAATRVNSSGLIETMAADTPRFDYTLNIGGACKGLLIEESRKNLALNTVDFSSNWTAFAAAGTGTSVLATNQATSPDGTSNAARWTSVLGSSPYCMLYSSTITVTTATVYTISAYMKSATGSTQVVLLREGFTGSISPAFVITNEWQRFSFSFTSSGTSAQFNFWNSSGSSSSIDAYIYGAQMELGSFATSYIPTNAAQVTRNADVATMTGTNFSDWWNNSEGSLNMQYARIANGVAGKFPYAGYIYTDVNNRFEIYQNSNTAESVAGRASGATSFGFNFTIATANQLVNAVMAYKQNNFASCINAAATQTDASGNIPTVNTFYIGGINSTGFEVNGWMKKINYWPQRLTNAEVQAFSK